MKGSKKCVSVLLAVITIMSVMLVGGVPGTVKASAASWNGTNYGGGTLMGSRTFLQAFGIDYDVYMKWLDDHDADSPNPNYYLGTPYAHNDHRNPRGDCSGAYGAYDSKGVAAMNCTGFVWHVLYKSAVNSGASRSQINQLQVMYKVPLSWADLGIYRIYFNTIEEAYDSGVLEKGDLMWIYGSSDNHNAIFYGDSPEDFIYWDSAGKENRYSKVHSIGTCRGLYVAKVTQPNNIELHIDTPSGGDGVKFGTKYCIFDSKAKAQAVIDNPDDDTAWDKREGTIVLNTGGHGVFRTQSAPAATDLWSNGSPKTSHSYFSSPARRVSAKSTYYAVQWSHGSGIEEDRTIHEFKDSGKRTGTGYRIFNFIAPIKVDAPAITGMKNISDGVRISWTPVKGVSKYRIYYKNRYGVWTKMVDTKSTTYVDTDVKNGAAYTYSVSCMDNYGNVISDYDTTGWRWTFSRLDTPEITLTADTPEGIQIDWNAVEGAERYRVYYKNKKGSWVKMTETTDTTYVDDVISKGTAYTYTVRCVDSEGDFISDYNKTGWKHTYQGVATPAFESLTSEPEGVRLTWQPTEGVAMYRVYYKSKKGEWVKMSDVDGTAYLDDDVRNGTTYTYSIRCFNSKGYAVSDMNTTGWKQTYEGVATPQITSFSSEADGVHLSWEPVEGAVRYRAYYKSKNGSWKLFAETSDTQCVDDVVALNTAYTYTIRCVTSIGKFASGYNDNGWTYTYAGVDAPQQPALENTAEGVNIRWNPVEGAAKYRVFYLARNGSWKVLDTTDGTELLDTDVTPGYHYVYTVRCIGPRGNLISDYAAASERIEYLPPVEPAEPADLAEEE